MNEILNYFGVGGIIFILLTVFIEITPIKINPIQWLGKRFNHHILEKVSGMEGKLDEHIAQSYRNKILTFQNECLLDQQHTQEEFDEVLEAITKYEKYCKDNQLENDKCKLAIKYIKHVYFECCTNASFANLAVVKSGTE